MKHLWKKMIVGGSMGLFPACIDAAEWLKKTKLEQDVMLDPRRPRNTAHHKKLFALFHLAVDNWPEPVTVSALRGALLIKAGEFDEVQTSTGMMKIPRSMAFESMNQETFDPFYDLAVLMISRVIGVSVEDLEQNKE